MERGFVVVVDDDSQICDLLVTTLTDEGHIAVATGCSSSGLALIRRHKPAFVILDIHLSGVINGFALANLLRAAPTTADIPIILCTGDRQFLRDHAREIHVRNYITLPKPFELADVLDCIQRATCPPVRERAVNG